MTLLRIYSPLLEEPRKCEWALFSAGGEFISGAGFLADLPRRVERVQLVIPYAQVLITRARVPHSARKNSGSVLAFAVEEKMAAEPDTNQVSWLGAIGEEAALAVLDKGGLELWRVALGTLDIHIDDVQCETLLLPLRAGEWSVAWNGSDGFVRCGKFEGAAMDCGDRTMPPLLLRLMLEEARAGGSAPTAIALYSTSLDGEVARTPDTEAWQRELGVAVRLAGNWNWRMAPPDAGVSLVQPRRAWGGFAGLGTRLRPAAWILTAALVLHALALVADWTRLRRDQQALHQQMEARFRTAFPDALAVADPPLQMRRKLVEARHAAGLSDSGDFLPMIDAVAKATRKLPVGAVRAISYEGGRMTVELGINNEDALLSVKARLVQDGLSVDTSPSAGRSAAAKVVLIVRAP